MSLKSRTLFCYVDGYLNEFLLQWTVATDIQHVMSNINAHVVCSAADQNGGNDGPQEAHGDDE